MQKYTQTPSRSDPHGRSSLFSCRNTPRLHRNLISWAVQSIKCRSQLRQLRDLISGASSLFSCRNTPRLHRNLISWAAPVYLVAEIHPDSIEISSHGRSSLFSCRNTPRLPSKSHLMGGPGLYKCRSQLRQLRDLISWTVQSI